MVPPLDQQEVSVYQGTVEFIRPDDWITELQTLLDECSTNEEDGNEPTIYAIPPDRQKRPEAAAAWAKINQVYGGRTMSNYCGLKKSVVFQRLSTNPRVRKLLTPPEGKAFNSVVVNEGTVTPNEAAIVLQDIKSMGLRAQRQKKKWALDFRNSINKYVYSDGNSDLPQSWPLIRKVVLEGPWPVLATAACLVDLPGVRDANAARAKVSEQYLKDVHHIFVVAPIKRAVDDGTARELLGEQFKRRLLMDGS